MCTHPLLSAGVEEGGLNLQPNFLKEGGYLTGPQLLEGIAGIEGVTFSGGGGLQILHQK